MLVRARPLHAHRLTDGFRKQRRVCRRIFMAIAAVAAGAVDIDAAHVVAPSSGSGKDCGHPRRLHQPELAKFVRTCKRLSRIVGRSC